jgi:hypothetical protein
MTGRTTVTVPDLVGQPVDVASEMAAAVGLLLSSEDPDGPGIRSRTWPGLFWVTAQDLPAGSVVERETQMRVAFIEDGQSRSNVQARTGGPLPSLESHADAPVEPDAPTIE